MIAEQEKEIAPITAGRTSVPARKQLRAVAILVIVLTGILIFTLVTSRTDCVSYWSAGQLLLHHADPYSPAGALAIEKAHGFYAGYMVMLNPPWALFLAAPLGFGGLRLGLFLWTLAGVACIFASAFLLRVPSKDRAFAFVFAPAVAAVFMGQSSAFPLLGFAFFLRFYRSRPFLAGASLLLMAIKPHLFLVFWAVLLADCIYHHRFSIVAGFASALAFSTAFAMCFDPRVFPHYFAMLRTSTLQHDFFPTASMLFRMLIDVRAFWLLFVPSTLAIAWGLWYYARYRNAWDWRIHGLLLMLITILVSPYSWFTDEAVLLPCILYVLTLPEKRSHSAWILLTINTAALYLVFVHQAALTSRAYLWTSAVWLLWFLYATHGSRHQLPSLSQPAVQQA
jgi:hypothetical protein